MNRPPCSVDTGASNYQTDAFLFQMYQCVDWKPLEFWSRSLNTSEENYSTTDKEHMAVVWEIQTLCSCHQRSQFTVHIDQPSLCWLMSINVLSNRLLRFRLKLSESYFEVRYNEGRINTQTVRYLVSSLNFKGPRNRRNHIELSTRTTRDIYRSGV